MTPAGPQRYLSALQAILWVIRTHPGALVRPANEVGDRFWGARLLHQEGGRLIIVLSVRGLLRAAATIMPSSFRVGVTYDPFEVARLLSSALPLVRNQGRYLFSIGDANPYSDVVVAVRRDALPWFGPATDVVTLEREAVEPFTLRGDEATEQMLPADLAWQGAHPPYATEDGFLLAHLPVSPSLVPSEDNLRAHLRRLRLAERTRLTETRQEIPDWLQAPDSTIEELGPIITLASAASSIPGSDHWGRSDPPDGSPEGFYLRLFPISSTPITRDAVGERTLAGILMRSRMAERERCVRHRHGIPAWLASDESVPDDAKRFLLDAMGETGTVTMADAGLPPSEAARPQPAAPSSTPASVVSPPAHTAEEANEGQKAEEPAPTATPASPSGAGSNVLPAPSSGFLAAPTSSIIGGAPAQAATPDSQQPDPTTGAKTSKLAPGPKPSSAFGDSGNPFGSGGSDAFGGGGGFG